jgi:hypothetical protein
MAAPPTAYQRITHQLKAFFPLSTERINRYFRQQIYPD